MGTANVLNNHQNHFFGVGYSSLTDAYRDIVGVVDMSFMEELEKSGFIVEAFRTGGRRPWRAKGEGW